MWLIDQILKSCGDPDPAPRDARKDAGTDTALDATPSATSSATPVLLGAVPTARSPDATPDDAPVTDATVARLVDGFMEPIKDVVAPDFDARAEYTRVAALVLAVLEEVLAGAYIDIFGHRIQLRVPKLGWGPGGRPSAVASVRDTGASWREGRVTYPWGSLRGVFFTA